MSLISIFAVTLVYVELSRRSQQKTLSKNFGRKLLVFCFVRKLWYEFQYKVLLLFSVSSADQTHFDSHLSTTTFYPPFSKMSMENPINSSKTTKITTSVITTENDKKRAKEKKSKKKEKKSERGDVSSELADESGSIKTKWRGTKKKEKKPEGK
jgi:hypothetical protein